MLSMVNCALTYQAGVQSGSEVVTTSKTRIIAVMVGITGKGPTFTYAMRTQKMMKVLTCFKHAVSVVEEEPIERIRSITF